MSRRFGRQGPDEMGKQPPSPPPNSWRFAPKASVAAKLPIPPQLKSRQHNEAKLKELAARAALVK
jgi:hypothetical protein